ncbi:MAG: hypothetical protein AAFZ65_12665, partial [Planctomycetota bacterium]
MNLKHLLLAAIAGLTFATSGWSQASSPDARVSLRIEGRQLREVVDFLREQSGANIVILDEEAAAEPAELAGTLRRGVTPRTVIAIIALTLIAMAGAVAE